MVMNEQQQLAILEKIPGFVRPSAEWLRGLEVGDRVMAVFVADFNRVGRSGEYIVHNKGEKMFTLYPANGGKKQQVQVKGWHLTAEGRGCGYWLSPIGPHAKHPPAEPPKPFKMGDVVRMTFTDKRLEPGQFVDARIFSIVGWGSQINYHLDLPSSHLYTIDEEESPFDRDGSYLIHFYDGSFQLYTEDLDGAFCDAGVIQ
jgi:hypothetical protein